MTEQKGNPMDKLKELKSAAAVLYASVVRTVVPYIVGVILGWAAAAGIEVDDKLEAALGAVLAALFGTLWYVIARVLEVYVSPRFGWLLGLAKSPDAYSAEKPGRHEAS